MSGGKHTAGPWLREGDFHDLCRVEFSGGGHYVTLSGGDRTLPVAFVIGDPDTYWRDDVQTEANARLIASAPDLLEAATRAEDVIDDFLGHLSHEEQAADPTVGQVLVALRAAIAKATGADQ